jgi:rhodanese-related sulfurtransferase
MSKVKHKSKNTKEKGQGSLDRLFWISIIGGSIVLLTVLVFYFTRSQASSKAGLPSEISVSEAYERYQTNTVFVDVREKSEWKEYHIPNTIHIPLGELEKRVNELSPDSSIVVVCRSGNRSQAGRDIFLKAGFPFVSSMAGGLKEWQSAGYPIVTGE